MLDPAKLFSLINETIRRMGYLFSDMPSGLSVGEVSPLVREDIDTLGEIAAEIESNYPAIVAPESTGMSYPVHIARWNATSSAGRGGKMLKVEVILTVYNPKKER